MAKERPKSTPAPRSREHALLLEVEQLESLAEELEETGLSTLAEVRQRIQELHRQLDALEADA